MTTTIPRLNYLTVDEALNVLALSPPDLHAEAIVEHGMKLKHKDVRKRARFIVASECPQTRYVTALEGSLRECDRRQANKPLRKPTETPERVGPSFAESWGVNTFNEFVSPDAGEPDHTADQVAHSSDETAHSSDKEG